MSFSRMQEQPLDITKDPRGLTPRDLAHLRSVFQRRPPTPKTPIQEIMYMEGQQNVLDYIENKMIGNKGYVTGR